MTAGDLTASGLTADAIAALPYRENVGVMLLNAAGKVFVGQRLDNRTPAWQMPQGGTRPQNAWQLARLTRVTRRRSASLSRGGRASERWNTQQYSVFLTYCARIGTYCERIGYAFGQQCIELRIRCVL